MLRIEVEKAKPGMKLALAVQNPQAPDKALLNVGFALTEPIIERLTTCGIRHLWVRYPSLAFLERYLDTESLQCQQEVVKQITQTFETLQGQSSARLDYNQYTTTLGRLVEALSSHRQSALFLGDLAEHADDLMRHSAAVTYLSLLMGMKLEAYIIRERKHVDPARAKELTNLGLGAMLHDVGVTQLDPEVRSRYTESGDESDPAWQEHPAKGFRMVREHVDPSAATCVLNHHQRSDGSGYAGSDFPVLSGDRVHVFGRIVAVADQFDRLRTPPGLPPQPTVWVLGEMLNEPLRGKFDHEALLALLAVVPPYAPGSLVRLSDGRHAVVIEPQSHDPCRPTVQVIPDPAALENVEDPPAGPTVKLSDHAEHGLSIVEHDGHEVGDLNFSPPLLTSQMTREYAWA